MNHAMVASRLCSPVSALASDTRGLGSLKDNVEVVGTEEQDSGGAEVVVGGEEVAKFVTMPARTSPSSMASRPSATASYHLNPTPFSTTSTLSPRHDGLSILLAHSRNVYQLPASLPSRSTTPLSSK